MQTSRSSKFKKDESKLDNGMKVQHTKTYSIDTVKSKSRVKGSKFVKYSTLDGLEKSKPKKPENDEIYNSIVLQINLFKDIMDYLNKNPGYFTKPDEEVDETFKLSRIKILDKFCKLAEDLELNLDNLATNRDSFCGSFVILESSNALATSSERRIATYKNYIGSIKRTLAEIISVYNKDSFIDANLGNTNEFNEPINITPYTKTKSVNLEEQNMSRIRLFTDFTDGDVTILEESEDENEETSEKALTDLLGRMIQVNNFFDAKTTIGKF
jgi:hypothetical protein